MEKKQFSSLNENDRALIRQIESFYEAGVRLFGSEPYIYLELGITPPAADYPGADKLAGIRQQVFGKKASERKTRK